MTKELLIYERAVPLRVEAHRDMSVRPLRDFNFAKEINSVPIVAAEFSAAAVDMTIVFAGVGDKIVPAVLLGLDAGTNRFLDDEGNWTGRYVPAFLRRYPFVFATSPETDDLLLCVDEAYEGLNGHGAGERLFDSDGNRTIYLNGVIEFATQYQAQHDRTSVFCRRLVELELLEAAVASFTDESGEERRLTGFFRINRAKLKVIKSETLSLMFSNDELELCFTHLASLVHIDRLSRPAASPVGAESSSKKKKVQ